MSAHIDNAPQRLVRSSRTAALLMVILVTLGGALVVSVPPTPDRGGAAPFLAVATGAIITLLRAWELGRPAEGRPVLTARRWKLILFIFLVITFGCYAVWAAVTYGNPFVPGAFLMMTAFLIGTLTFEPNPSTDRGIEIPAQGSSY